MSGYDKNKLALIAQGLAGKGKVWVYQDTGDPADIAEGSGYFANGNDMGMDSGDFIFIKMSRGGGRRDVFGTSVQSTSDTGGTQSSGGKQILIGDR
jgi:hypothetical protein